MVIVMYSIEIDNCTFGGLYLPICANMPLPPKIHVDGGHFGFS